MPTPDRSRQRVRTTLSLLAASTLMVTAGHPVAARDDAGPTTGSVYQLAPVWDGTVILSSLVVVSLPYMLSSHLITPKCSCAPASVNAFDRGVIGNANDAADWISSLTVGLALVGPPLIDWMALSSRKTLAEDVTVFLEAIAVNGALVTGVKYAVQRPIPRVYSQPGAAGLAGNYRSFYSGHTSMAFAALSVVSMTADARYGLSWQPWAVTGAIGTSVAVERVMAGRHFYSDVLVGAAAGTAVGTLVSWVHLRTRRLSITAWLPRDQAGVGLVVSGSL